MSGTLRFLLPLLFACAPDDGAVPAAGPAGAPVSAEAPAAASPEELKARHEALRKQIRALVGDLQTAGRYDCCVEAPCSTCALRMGGCKCGEGLRRGEPVCEECAMMWRAGRGAEAGVDPATVESFLEAETRKKQEAAGCACPGHAGGAPGAAAPASGAAPAKTPAPTPAGK